MKGRLLYKFLKKKRCLPQYIDNTLLYRSLSTTERPIDVINFLAKNREISHAFCWANTPQGHEYWAKLFSEFENLKYIFRCEKILCEKNS